MSAIEVLRGWMGESRSMRDAAEVWAGAFKALGALEPGVPRPLL